MSLKYEISLWDKASDEDFNRFENNLKLPEGYSGEHACKIDSNDACLICNKFVLGSR